MFTVGDVLVLSMALIIVLIFRYLDRGNRSLEKVKRFTGRVREELAAVAEEKAQQLKDLAINVGVHQQSVVEAIKQLEASADELNQRASHVEEIQIRIDQYDLALKQLVEMTNQAEQNIKGIQQESAYVDTVGRRIKEAKKHIEVLEKTIPGIIDKFSAENRRHLEADSESVFQEGKKTVLKLKEQVDHVQAQVQETIGSFQADVDQSQQSIEEYVMKAETTLQQTFTGMQADATDARNDISEATEKAQAELQQTFTGMQTDATDARNDISEAAEKAQAELQQTFTGMQTDVTDARNDISEAAEKAQAELQQTFTGMQTDVTDARNGISEAAEKAQAELQQTFTGMQADVTHIRNGISETAEKTQAVLQGTFDNMQSDMSDFQSTVSEMTEQSHKTIEDSFNQYEKDFTDLEKVFRERMNSIADKARKFEMESFELFQKELSSRRTELAVSFEEALEQQKQEFQNQLSQYQTDTQDYYDQLSGSVKENVEAHEQKLNELNVSVQNSIESLNDSIVGKHEEFQATMAQKSSGLEKQILGDLEKRLADYESDITYRLSRLDGVSTELNDLEEKLKENMGQMEGKLDADVQKLSEQLQAKHVENFQQFRGELDDLSSDIEHHKNELSSIKEESHANIAEQLSILEKDFFTDLKERKHNINVQLENWTEEFNGTLDTIKQEGEEERLTLEKKYLEDFSSRIDILRKGLASRADELQKAFLDRETLMREDISVLEERISSGRTVVDEKLNGLQQQSMNLLESRCQEIQEQMSARMKNMQRDMEGNLKNMDDLISEQEVEVKGLYETIRSDAAVWQNQIVQKLKTEKNDIEGEIANFRMRIDETLLSMKEEYHNEKEGIVSEGESARKQLEDGIQSASSQLNMLQSDLEEKKEEALERFNLDYKAFMQVFSQQREGASREIETSIHNFQEFVVSVRAEFEATQKRLINNLNDDIKTVEINIREIEKKQKSFLQQTKLFDRADSLKQGLSEDIDQLRTEINRFQNERKQIGEYENEFLRIQKLGEEANEKMVRFSLEQRKLDSIDDGYKRLLALSSKVDTSLDSINAKHDSAQKMQLAIRNLDELQKELDQRHDRLAKRKEVIDATVEGVDRNFHQLTDLDTRIDEVNKLMNTVTNDIAVLKSRLEGLSVNKKESDMAMRNLQNLNQLMDTINERTADMHKAREWLARTETRMEEVAQQADKHVEILGAVTRQSHPEEGERLSVSERDMVIKLKHQGWNIEDIAKTCKISRGEVELILEMEPVKASV